jgi:hypothetical protein
MPDPTRIVFYSCVLAVQFGQTAQAADLSEPLTPRANVEFYGQINKGLLIYDDGHSTETYFPVDNGNSSTRAGMRLHHELSPGIEIGFNVEGEWTPYSTGYVNQLNKGDVDWDSSLLRKLEAYIDVRAVGKFWVGQGSMASDGTAEVDLSGTTIVGYSSVADSAGGQLYRLDDDTLSSVSVGSTFSNLDGLGRRLRVRYDTPSLNGFTVSASAGQVVVPHRVGDIGWDVALRYNAELTDYKIAAAVAISDRGEDSQAVLDGSASILHLQSGWSFTVAAGYEKLPERHREYGYAKIGHQSNYFDLGTTAYSLDLYLGDDIRTSASESVSVGGQFVQEIDPWQSELYLGVRSYEFEAAGGEYKAGFSVLAGAILKL